MTSHIWSRTSIFRTLSISLIASFFLFPFSTLAADLTDRSDTMTREKVSTASDHTIRFTTPTGVDDPADTITLAFPNFSLGSVAFADIDLTHGPVTGAETSEVLAAAPAVGVWGVTVVGQQITFTAPTNAVVGRIAAGDKVIVLIGTNASGGVNQITNPSSAGAYPIGIAGTFGDIGQIGVPILTDDVVNVSAVVPPPPPPQNGPGGPTLPVISNVQAHVTSPTTATITWDTDIAANSSVDYGQTNGYGSGTVSNGAFVTSHSIDLVGLHPCTLYHFRVHSGAATTNDFTFTTPCDVTAPIISNVQAVNITDTSAIITWNTDEPATSFVEYGLTNAYGGTASVPGYVTSHGVPLSGLLPGTLYHFRVTSIDPSGNSAVSGDFTFTTTTDTTPPGNVVLTATPGNTVVQLTWTLPSDPDLAGTRIVRKLGGFPSGPFDGTLVYQGTGTSHLDTGRTNGVTYYYGAYAYDANGNFASGALAAATPVGPVVPPPPTPPPVTPPPGATSTPPTPGTTIQLNLFGAGGSLPLGVGAGGTIGVLTNINMLARVPLSSMNGTPTIVVFVLNGSTYNLAYNPSTASYEGTAQTPAPGTYPAKAQAIFTDGRVAETTVTVRTIPGGTVYEMPLIGPANVPVTGAEVKLFERVGGSWVSWNGSAYGQSSTQLTNVNGAYAYQIPPGEYYVEVTKDGYEKYVGPPTFLDTHVFGSSIQLVKQVPPPLEVISPTSTVLENVAAVVENLGQQVAHAIGSLRSNPEVQRFINQFLAPGLVALALANMAAAVSLFNALAFLQYFFTQPILLLGRRKRKRWGVVYNSLTKVPIDLAIVRLIQAKTGLTVQSRVTDKEGRYVFTAAPGEYRIEAIKPGYVFPSQYLKGQKVDAEYVDLYLGDTVRVTEQTALVLNIPLDPVVPTETPKQVTFRKTLRGLQHAIALSGVVLTAAALVISPTIVIGILLVSQIAIYFLFRRLNLPPKPKSWGFVYDEKTRKPLSRVVVRVFETKFNKLLETQITDTTGRYGFLVRKNVYYVTAEAPGYRMSRVPDIDLTKTKEEIVAKNIALQKGKAAVISPLSPPTPPSVISPASDVPPSTPMSSDVPKVAAVKAPVSKSATQKTNGTLKKPVSEADAKRFEGL